MLMSVADHPAHIQMAAHSTRPKQSPISPLRGVAAYMSPCGLLMMSKATTTRASWAVQLVQLACAMLGHECYTLAPAR